MPQPLSVTCSTLSPPALTATVMAVEPASRQFSSISLSAELGRWMTSPAAMRLTTDGSSRTMRRAGGGGGGGTGGAAVTTAAEDDAMAPEGWWGESADANCRRAGT
jgi:hypothetical protein